MLNLGTKFIKFLSVMLGFGSCNIMGDVSYVSASESEEEITFEALVFPDGHHSGRNRAMASC